MNWTEVKRLLPRREPSLVKTGERGIIPVCEPLLNGNELKYLAECIRSGWVSSAGSFIVKFENQFKQHCDAKYAVSCSSGTAALHLALAALGIGRGDEVIVPAFTMIATANAATYLGAKPVFVDAAVDTWNMDPDRISERITRRTKAIIPVHTYGFPADMDSITSIARRHNLSVVEDAAEAHGAEYRGRRVGSIGDVSCFSFYANKIITTGEGGMVTTNNRRLADRVRLLRDHAFSKERHFWHRHLGYNYRMTNLQAAIGLAQAERFEKLVKMKIRNARYYASLLRGIKGVTLPPESKRARNVYWMYAILIDNDFGLTRDALRYFLARRGIETRVFFIPLHLQPIYFTKRGERFPVAEDLCRRGLYLPSSVTLAKSDIEYIVRCIKSVQDSAAKN